MKFAEVEFALGEKTHTLRAECETKFWGGVLELKLDGTSISLTRNAKKYSFFRFSLEDTEITVFVRLSDRGVPSLELLVNGKALSSGKSEEEFLAEAATTASKSGKMTALKNAVLYFVLFSLAGFLMGILRFGSEQMLRTILLGLLCGAVITILFLIWDLVDLRNDMNALKKGQLSPTRLSPEEEGELSSEIDESVDPDSVEIPADSVSFYDRMAEEEAADDDAKADEKGEAAEAEPSPAGGEVTEEFPITGRPASEEKDGGEKA